MDVICDESDDNSTPYVGMEFDTLDEAWNFWTSYGGKMGFNTRKDFKNQKKKDCPITSRGFVCSNEGYRANDKRRREVKRPRAETRTGCPVRLFLRLIKETHKWVYEFYGVHNHDLQHPKAARLMPLQRHISGPHAVTIDLADDSGIRPREAYDLMGREAGGRENLPFTRRDYANHLRNNRRKNLACGEATSMLRYFYNRTLENGSFQHIEQLDDNGQIMNVFWADAKMLIDYAHFGDVITFDTTYSTNKEFRPLGVFVGFNHFREITVFGAALLYEETVDSFKWLFEIFLATHNNKHPKTIFIDQDQAVATALKAIMPNTYHSLCIWHINQNAIRNLMGKKGNEVDNNVSGKKDNEADKKISGKEILKEFKSCMFDYDDEKEFNDAFNSLLNRVRGTSVSEDTRTNVSEGEVIENSEVSEEEECTVQHSEDQNTGVKRKSGKKKAKRENWLNFIFMVKEKWAECYIKDVFTLGMRSTQLSECFNRDLKSHLKWNMDIIRFFKHFESVLVQKRENEVESEYEMRKKQPRLKANIPILQQAGALYTPKVFEIFQTEWELSMAVFVKSKYEGASTIEYRTGIRKFGTNSELDKTFLVTTNHADETITCSCNKFKRIGVLCGHALKVLDIMDIKFIPKKYVLKRWTREAKNDIIEDLNGNIIVENTKLDSTQRYRVLCRKLLKLAARAADFEEVSQFLDVASDGLHKEIEIKIQNLSITPTNDADVNGGHIVPLLYQPNLGPKVGTVVENTTQNPISFKKKEGRKGGKRLVNWVQKLKNAKKGKSAKSKGQDGNNVSEAEGTNQISKGDENANSSVPISSTELGDYGYLNSIMQFLEGGSIEVQPLFSDNMESTPMHQIKDARVNMESTYFGGFVMSNDFTGS